MCYLDEANIFGRTFYERNQRLSVVLDSVKQPGLILNAKKCHFGERQALVLGYLVDKDGIRPDPHKITAVRNFKQLTTVKDLRSFLGLFSYFRRFIKDFAQLAHPLPNLLRKDTPYQWTVQCETAFEQLKFLLTSGPLLRHFDPQALTELQTDASGVGVGAVLVQFHDGRQHVVGYASQTLMKAESNYTVTELEYIPVVFALQKFRPYLYGRYFNKSLIWASWFMLNIVGTAQHQ